MADSTKVVRSLFASIAAALIASVTTEAARADDASDHAEALFKTAVTALDAGDFPTACPAFEESYRITPALGTAFNLAVCTEHTGKKVEALKQFRAVQERARAGDRKKTEADARAHAEALERAVARLRVPLAPSDSVTIDGKPAVPDSTGVELVEPGEYVVEVLRDGRSALRARITVGAGESKNIEVPAQSPVESAPESGSAMPWRTVAIGVAAAGLAGIGIGTGFGIAASSQRDTARSACGSGGIESCQSSGVSSATSAWSAAKTDATISTVGFITGAVLVAGGAVLYFFAPTTARRVGLAIDPRATGIGGRW